MVAAHRQQRLVVAGFLDLVLFVVLLDERIDILALGAFTGDETAPLIAQQRRQALVIGVFAAQRFDERLGGLFWRGKFLLGAGQARPGQAGSQRQGMQESAGKWLDARMVVQRRLPR